MSENGERPRISVIKEQNSAIREAHQLLERFAIPTINRAGDDVIKVFSREQRAKIGGAVAFLALPRDYFTDVVGAEQPKELTGYEYSLAGDSGKIDFVRLWFRRGELIVMGQYELGRSIKNDLEGMILNSSRLPLEQKQLYPVTLKEVDAFSIAPNWSAQKAS